MILIEPGVRALDGTPLPVRIRGVRQVTVMEVHVAEGAGTEESPVRHVRYYYDEEGEILAWYDPMGLVREAGQVPRAEKGP